jgi:hypothetical protein
MKKTKIALTIIGIVVLICVGLVTIRGICMSTAEKGLHQMVDRMTDITKIWLAENSEATFTELSGMGAWDKQVNTTDLASHIISRLENSSYVQENQELYELSIVSIVTKYGTFRLIPSGPKALSILGVKANSLLAFNVTVAVDFSFDDEGYIDIKRTTIRHNLF